MILLKAVELSVGLSRSMGGQVCYTRICWTCGLWKKASRPHLQLLIVEVANPAILQLDRPLNCSRKGKFNKVLNYRENGHWGRGGNETHCRMRYMFREMIQFDFSHEGLITKPLTRVLLFWHFNFITRSSHKYHSAYEHCLFKLCNNFKRRVVSEVRFESRILPCLI